MLAAALTGCGNAEPTSIPEAPTVAQQANIEPRAEERYAVGALHEFWQVGASGEYENVGFRWRGKLFADYNGDYQLETILPGLYPGRPAHIHVKVTAPGRPEHTTQIYFPGAHFGDAERFVDAALVATLEESSGENMVATLNFVLDS